MKLSRTVAYALQATLQLAQSETGAPVPCSQLASEGHMPERFLLQILRNLVNHGILQSTRGVEGGYTLERRPEEISLLQIIEAIEGPLSSNAQIGDGLPPECQQQLRSALTEVTATARRQLDSVKLASLLCRKEVAVQHGLVNQSPVDQNAVEQRAVVDGVQAGS